MLVLGDGVEGKGVQGNVEDGGGVEPEGVESNVEDGGGMEPEGVQANVEDGGGVDIGEHHGMEGVGEEDDEEDEGHGGQGIGTPIDEDMECDDDGGHASEDSSWLREVEFIEGEIKVQSEGTRDEGEGDSDSECEGSIDKGEGTTNEGELLIQDVGGVHVCEGITFMSDQQKGLLSAIQELIPGAVQRFCVRHLYSNFRKKYLGKKLKSLMWRAAGSTYPQAWEREMRAIKEVNDDAFKHLIALPPRFWSKSRFTFPPKCDSLVNNISEAFNSVLVPARGKPIITMLEDIRTYIMQRWAKNRLKIASFEGSICPKISSRLQKEANQTRYWITRSPI
ncbi:hypothetical protein VNO80_30723 [Phaseolus coccineus]|uniref:Mutator-like transposase n=1 Tax=Phaseolus coccineus TaxID=3886 RepID=A0AAN9LDB5_PHACN